MDSSNIEFSQLGKNGYILKSNHPYPDNFIDEVVNELTVSPKDNGYGKVKAFHLYRYDKFGNWSFPRYYGLKKFGPPDNFLFRSGKPLNFEFKLKIRPEQIEPINCVLNGFKENGGGILSARTGLGKTICAIYCISKLKCKTIVIVNRVELIRQWKRELERCLSNIKVGEIRGEIFDIDNKDIVIGMVNTLSMKKYNAKKFRNFDLLIVDECHNVASEVFHLCLPKIQTKYTLGLSASPYRKDGLFNVVEWFLGPVVFKSDNNIDSKMKVIVNFIRYSVKSRYAVTQFSVSNQKPNISGMINNIANNPERTNFIVECIKWILRNNNETETEKRKILLMSDRKILLRNLNDKLNELNISNGLYIGDMKPEEYQITKEKDVILGTYSICGTGFDLPALNTLILGTPRTDILQIVGRILRKQHEINPLILDIVDEFSIFKFQGRARMRYYEKNKLTINEILINDPSQFDYNQLCDVSKRRKYEHHTGVNEVNEEEEEKEIELPQIEPII